MTKTVTKQQEKLKSLMTMLLRWAEINKRAVLHGQFEVPEKWRKAFKYVTRLENKTSLSRIHMIECNKLYREYRC